MNVTITETHEFRGNTFYITPTHTAVRYIGATYYVDNETGELNYIQGRSWTTTEENKTEAKCLVYDFLSDCYF